MESLSSAEMSVTICHSTQRNVLDDLTLVKKELWDWGSGSSRYMLHYGVLVWDFAEADCG